MKELGPLLSTSPATVVGISIIVEDARELVGKLVADPIATVVEPSDMVFTHRAPENFPITTQLLHHGTNLGLKT
jgi:hypothetical protein